MVDQSLRAYLRRWGVWLRLVQSLAWSAWGLAAGLTLALTLALAARLQPLLLPAPLSAASLSLAAVGTGLGLLAAWLRPRSRHRLARTLDRSLVLAERLTTALEIETGRLIAPPAMARAQHADTLSAAARIDVRTALPLRLPHRALLASAALAAALAATLLLPNPQDAILRQQQAVQAAVEEQIEALEAAQEEIAATEALTEEERAALLQALEEAIQALEEGRADPEDAIAALSEAEQTLSALQDPAAAELAAGLEQAAESLADSDLTEALAEALAGGDYQTAAQELAAFAGDQGEALTPEEMLELADELAQAAQAVAESNPDLAEQLSQAAQAIRDGDIAAAREAIAQAAAQMGAAGELVEQQEAIEDTLAALQEGREEIAAAGGGQSPNPGSAGGQQSGSGQTAGQPGGGQQSGSGPGESGHNEDAGSGAPYDEIYVPERIKDEGVAVDVGGAGNDDGLPGDDTPLPVPIGGTASTPYQDVYAEYAAEAQAALEGSYIPLGMKQYVRDYFTSLEPE
ncbi:MAG: hypothetical protein JXD18_10120 [Anaerolineae bacterium]|nr:hypothetical protein [Anaerolineae bacterium]